jgi:L-asparagine oxygenase
MFDHEISPDVQIDPGDAPAIDAMAAQVSTYDFQVDPEGYVTEAQRLARGLPSYVFEALQQFRRKSAPTGGLLIRGLPTGPMPPTPAILTGSSQQVPKAVAVLSMCAAILGEQCGFAPELGGEIVQSIWPAFGSEDTQESVSSTTELYEHTEMAFTDNRADYVGLFCIRQDHEARAVTTLSSIRAMLPLLNDSDVSILRDPRYTTTVDGSFLKGLGRDTPIRIGNIAVIGGSTDRPTLRADFAETEGTDTASSSALAKLRDASRAVAVGVRLRAGDLLFADNHESFHGRTSFTPRWDGMDRWLLRTFVTCDLRRSAKDRPRDGRVVDADYSLHPDIVSTLAAAALPSGPA